MKNLHKTDEELNKMNYSVRKLKNSDIKELSIIMKAAFLNEPWKEEWNDKVCFKRLNVFCNFSSSFCFTLINENNEICGAAIGYVVPFINKIEYDLQEFFINPKLSKNHLGTFFMNELIKKVKEAKIDTIKFYTSGDLYKFYGKFGFQKIENEYLMDLNIE